MRVLGRLLLMGLMSATAVAPAQAVDVDKHDVFEHVINQDSGVYSKSLEVTPNVWRDVSIDVHLTAPSGRVWTIGGFYYAEDDWRFRFSPNETGNWTYAWDFLEEGQSIASGNGNFRCVEAGRKGFLRTNPNNPKRWVFEEGGSFHPYGWQDCLFDDLNYQYPIGNWQTRLFPGMIATYHDAGFNIWRLGVDNCSFPLNFNEINLRTFDQYAQWLYAEGIRVYTVLQGFDPIFNSGFSAGTPAVMARVDLYLRHLVHRYAAWTDIWEIGNEIFTNEYDDDWLQACADSIRAADPYGHPVSMSFERPDHPTIEINAPHRYISSQLPMTNLATWWNNMLTQQHSWGKPVIYGEVGNGVCNNEPGTAYRWRVTGWLAFFRETSLVYWNTANFHHCFPAANVNMDAEFRDNMQALTAYFEDFDESAIPDAVSVSDAGVKAWALDGPRHYGLYLYAQNNVYGTTSGLTANVNVRRGGPARWIRPIDGAVLGKINVPPGASTLSVPDFSGDIALKVSARVRQKEIETGSPGSAKLTVCAADLSSGTSASLLLDSAPRDAMAWLLVSLRDQDVDWGGGHVVPWRNAEIHNQTIGADGSISLPIHGGRGPATVYLQYMYLDAAQPQGIGFSNAVEVQILP